MATIVIPVKEPAKPAPQPFFSDIFKDTNDLLNKDFYHANPLSLDIQTVATNGVNFTVKAKQPVPQGALATNLETKVVDSKNGLTFTQGWTNDNKLNSKFTLDQITPGLTTELNTIFNPTTLCHRSATTAEGEKPVAHGEVVDLNIKFIQPYFNARGVFNFVCGGVPKFVGDFTTSYDNVVVGTQIGYNITRGSISNYALALAYKQKDYSLGVQLDDKKIAAVSFSQQVNSQLSLGSRAILNPQVNLSKVNVEFVTKYVPDKNTQIKAKISDLGTLSLGYKQLLRPGITLGVGTAFDAVKLNEPVHKFGWSLSFNL
ncbi:mitochondrial outer membrane protein porin 1 [Monosporozyma unispora]|nr:Mitochondrial porin [Kazachstania unispora]